MRKNRAVFLDRDGTINYEVGYLGKWDKFKFIPGAVEALRELKEAGFKLVLITNQSGVEKGVFTLRDVENIHQKMQKILEKFDAQFDKIYFCPHGPERKCECRKPKTFFYQEASRELGLDLHHSYFVGDKERDLLPSLELGGETILVLSGEGRKTLKKMNFSPSFVAKDLKEASRWIVRRRKIKTWEEIKKEVKNLRERKKKIAFTNGCFDLLHPGHLKTFEFAKREADILVVGINTDESVRKLKGKTRPVMSLKERMEILTALEMIDFVVPFEEETPLRLIQEIEPDVLVKGADYPQEKVVGREVVEKRGGKVILVPLLKGVSTSKIIERISQWKK